MEYIQEFANDLEAGLFDTPERINWLKHCLENIRVGECPQCGGFLSRQEMHPYNACSRSMCQSCYERIYNRRNDYCVICKSSKLSRRTVSIQAQGRNWRQREYHRCDNLECKLKEELIHACVVGAAQSLIEDRLRLLAYQGHNQNSNSAQPVVNFQSITKGYQVLSGIDSSGQMQVMAIPDYSDNEPTWQEQNALPSGFADQGIPLYMPKAGQFDYAGIGAGMGNNSQSAQQQSSQSVQGACISDQIKELNRQISEITRRDYAEIESLNDEIERIRIDKIKNPHMHQWESVESSLGNVGIRAPQSDQRLAGLRRMIIEAQKRSERQITPLLNKRFALEQMNGSSKVTIDMEQYFSAPSWPKVVDGRVVKKIGKKNY